MPSRETITQEAIVLWRRKRKNYSVYNFITPRLGIITSSVPHRRLYSLRSSGYLQPFSRVYITVSSDGEYYSLQQVDGRSLIKGLENNLDNICYTAFIGELIVTLFTKGEANINLFQLIESFTQQIQFKSLPLASIILGWQLLSLAGFIPTGKEYSKGEMSFKKEVWQSVGIQVDNDMSLAIEGILNYSWHKDSALSIPKQLWKRLENLLFAYAMIQADKELESVNFLHAMKAKLF